MNEFKLMLGDNLKSLKELPDNFVDSIVTDPPYGLSFMGKKWDYEVPSVEFWREVYRVLKPGGHILSFGGTRTYHRMVVNIEDAGFEIRDQVMWIYGSGFPKSHNIGKAIDKIQGNEREVISEQSAPNIKKRDWVNHGGERLIHTTTKGTSEYEGWGTALKPANEPICVARKPLSEKTIADNVLRWGTGGINIDGCRIATDDNLVRDNKTTPFSTTAGWNSNNCVGMLSGSTEGRFPANIIFDEDASELLDEQSGITKSTKRNNPSTKKEGSLFSDVGFTITGDGEYSDKGGASRFFYVAKVSKKERNLGLDSFEDKNETTPNSYKDGIRINNRGEVREKSVTKNTHPTLKPINLMTYLCRLVTPVGGIVLDPFMGSGSTGISAMIEGFDFIGMEMDEEYFKIAEARISSYEDYKKIIK